MAGSCQGSIKLVPEGCSPIQAGVARKSTRAQFSTIRPVSSSRCPTGAWESTQVSHLAGILQLARSFHDSPRHNTGLERRQVGGLKKFGSARKASSSQSAAQADEQTAPQDLFLGGLALTYNELGFGSRMGGESCWSSASSFWAVDLPDLQLSASAHDGMELISHLVPNPPQELRIPARSQPRGT